MKTLRINAYIKRKERKRRIAPNLDWRSYLGMIRFDISKTCLIVEKKIEKVRGDSHHCRDSFADFVATVVVAVGTVVAAVRGVRIAGLPPPSLDSR